MKQTISLLRAKLVSAEKYIKQLEIQLKQLEIQLKQQKSPQRKFVSSSAGFLPSEYIQ